MALHRLEAIPSEITRLRLANALTRLQLAEKAGISVSRLHKIEGGIAGPVSVTTIQQLAAVLNCDPRTISEVVEVAS